MTKDELITKQQLEIEQLKEQVNQAKELSYNINGILYSIGAPLNDNKLGYSKEQLKPFFEISKNLFGIGD